MQEVVNQSLLLAGSPLSQWDLDNVQALELALTQALSPLQAEQLQCPIPRKILTGVRLGIEDLLFPVGEQLGEWFGDGSQQFSPLAW